MVFDKYLFRYYKFSNITFIIPRHCNLAKQMPDYGMKAKHVVNVSQDLANCIDNSNFDCVLIQRLQTVQQAFLPVQKKIKHSKKDCNLANQSPDYSLRHCPDSATLCNLVILTIGHVYEFPQLLPFRIAYKLNLPAQVFTETVQVFHFHHSRTEHEENKIRHT